MFVTYAGLLQNQSKGYLKHLPIVISSDSEDINGEDLKLPNWTEVFHSIKAVEDKHLNFFVEQAEVHAIRAAAYGIARAESRRRLKNVQKLEKWQIGCLS